jgi:hypothetical protein
MSSPPKREIFVEPAGRAVEADQLRPILIFALFSG